MTERLDTEGRMQRLNEIYEHLHAHHGIHTKVQFAEDMGYARAYISSALNGNPKNLTDALFNNINSHWPHVFNLDYLLTGEGYLLTDEEEVTADEIEKTIKSEHDIIVNYASLVRQLDDLRTQAKNELAEIQFVKSELQQARDDFRNAVSSLRYCLGVLSYQESNHLDVAAEPTNITK